jgi:hypothetical protein
MVPRIGRKIRTNVSSVTRVAISLLIVLILTKINPRRKALAKKNTRTE